MSGLLPSTPDVSGDPAPEPRVIGLDSDDAAVLLAALASDTARDVLAALHREPAPPSALADRVDTSIQNVQYHLEKLASADLIEVVDTCYSEKGREMSVYAPTNGPLVVFPDATDDGMDLDDVLTRTAGAVAVLGIVSILIEAIVRGLAPGIETGADGPTIAGDEPVGTHWLVDVITGVPPGALFFVGGITLLTMTVGFHWIARR